MGEGIGWLFTNLNTRNPEVATETIFENICSLLPGAPFSGLFQEALCSPNKFSRKVYFFVKQITIFQGKSFPLTRKVEKTDTIFSRKVSDVCSSNRYPFFRIIFLATEQILIFQEHYFLWLLNRY